MPAEVVAGLAGDVGVEDDAGGVKDSCCWVLEVERKKEKKVEFFCTFQIFLLLFSLPLLHLSFSPFSPASSSCDASHSALALSHASCAPKVALASASLALPRRSAAPAALAAAPAAAPAAPVSSARCDSSCSSQARPSLDERNLAEGLKVVAEVEVEEVEEEEGDEEGAEFGDDDEEEEEEVESLLPSTEEIATCSFEGARASAPRSFRSSAESGLVVSSLP